MSKACKAIYLVVSTAFVLFQIIAAAMGGIPGAGQRAIHLAFIFFLLFFGNAIEEGKKAYQRSLDIFFLIGGIAASIYLLTANDAYALRAGRIYLIDIVLGVTMVIVLLVSTRKVVGTPLAIVVSCFIVYSFIGPYLPGLLHHAGVPFPRLVTFTYMTSDGIMGTALYAAASYIVLFVIMGAIFQETGIGDYFTQLASGVFGSMRGGPAKVAVIGSAFFGSISGSAMANVISTGTFTIPLMKKTGFEDDYAAAIEASASTGGQIMPPVMGATAFVLAEIVGVPYFKVLIAALIPAILYFAAILITVDLYAKRHEIGGI